MDSTRQYNQQIVRIAYVVHTFEMGGIERCVARLSSHLDRQTFRPMVVCLNRSGAAARWIEHDDIEIVELHKQPRNDFGMIKRLARVLRDRRIDIVHSHNWGTLVETALARRWAGVPSHVHAERGTVLGDVQSNSARRWLRSRAMCWALNHAEAVVSNAHATAERVQIACGYPVERIKIIPNGVERPLIGDPMRARNEIRRQLRIDSSALVVGSVGRLVPVKNIRMAIEALADSRLSAENLHLVIVGDGPEEEVLHRRARELDVANRIHLVGQKENTAYWLHGMDIYVNTSHSEGMSQSIVEAMAAELPIVVTDVGDSRLLVNGSRACGLVVPAGDTKAFAGAILELALNPTVRASFSGHARERYAEDYRVETMAAAYQTLYQQLAQNHHRSASPNLQPLPPRLPSSRSLTPPRLQHSDSAQQ